MRKNLLPIVAAFIMLSGAAHAGSVTNETAQTIALNFFKLNVPVTGRAVTANLSYTQTESDGVVDFYVFNMAPVKGFVIVAANDNVQPVLAYSSETSFNLNGSGNGLSDWIKSTSARLHYAVLNNIPGNAATVYKWNSYLNGQNPVNTKATGIGPLCTTTWNQEPYYNALCPFNTTDNMRTVTGCVATAMAQIMKYWNYPAAGTGSNSYDDVPPNYSNNYGQQSASFVGPFNWAAMPNAVTSNTSPVDTLMYILGVSVNMDYGDDNQNGSGAFVLQSEAGGSGACSQNSYATYFYYNPNTLQGVHMAQYSTPAWISLMENELNSGRVIQYEGDDPTAGGHTWVCDGYESNGMLHMNWGWGGASDGYFAVGDLSAGGYNFSQNDAALIGIEPLLPVTLSVSAVNQSICTGGSTTLTASGPVGASYSWTPATGLSCTTCSSPVANPSNTTLYSVTVDSAGVQASTSLAVVITQSVTVNFSQVATPSCTMPERVAFTNTSANATNYIWDFGDGTTDTSVAPVHGYGNDGVYTVKLYASNACGADSLIKTQAVTISGGPPVSADKNICSGQSVNLSATALGNISWYDAAVQGNEFTSGTSYTTPVLSNTTTYYIGATVTAPVIVAGPVASSIGTGSYYTRTSKHGLVFNCTAAQKLISVDVYSDTSAKRSILLQDASGNTLDSTAVTITNGHATVTLNWQLPVADSLVLCIEGLNRLYRNSSGINFPYTSSDGTVSITGISPPSNFGSSYYFFYNWKLQQPVCQTTRTPVTVFVLNSGGGSFSASGTGTPTVNFSPSDTDATIYTWNFGDGNSSSSKAPQHTYATAGTYTVQLIVGNGTCSDTVAQSVNTLTTGMNEITKFSNFSIFPNPAKEQLEMNVSSSQVLSDCKVIIHNLLGETVYSNSVDLAAGVNGLHFNVSQFASGVYIISLQTGVETLNAKFVKSSE